MELPKLRLWARMIANGVHKSTEEPPNNYTNDHCTGTMPKRAKRESMHDVVVDAAKAVAEVFTRSVPVFISYLYSVYSGHFYCHILDNFSSLFGRCQDETLQTVTIFV